MERTDQHPILLQAISYGDERLAALLTPKLIDELAAKNSLHIKALMYVLHIIARRIPQGEVPRFLALALALERFRDGVNDDTALAYLAAIFRLDPKAATQELAHKAVGLPEREQNALLDGFLLLTFGDSVSASLFHPPEIPSETLAELVRLVFKTDDPTKGRKRPDGVVHRLDENDRAYWARNAVLNRFFKTPGAVTYEAILQLETDPNCPLSPSRLRELAEERAIQDSDGAPWPPAEAFEFERHHETAPRTAKDLLAVLVSRIEDMQHDLLHGDFAQGLTLKGLVHEVDVQNWIADRLRLKQGRAFSVVREPHVADEKEPDIQIRAKATDASVAMEIKVAESWTLRQLDDALEAQLCGRYLRSRDGRYGVLLLVHQRPREKGWEDTASGKFLSFPEVVAGLSARAAAIAASAHDAPQAEVCVLDVSGLSNSKFP